MECCSRAVLQIIVMLPLAPLLPSFLPAWHSAGATHTAAHYCYMQWLRPGACALSLGMFSA